MKPIILRVEPEICKVNSSNGNYSVRYFIKWDISQKNEINMSRYFWTRQEAVQWHDDTWQEIHARSNNI